MVGDNHDVMLALATPKQFPFRRRTDVTRQQQGVMTPPYAQHATAVIAFPTGRLQGGKHPPGWPDELEFNTVDCPGLTRMAGTEHCRPRCFIGDTQHGRLASQPLTDVK